MRHALATALTMLFVAGTLFVLPITQQVYAQECTGPDCAPPGGHQCERERKEAPTA
ncbi:MAG: hypothetical protein JJ913_03020 [Rhizobiaceae bacterium]|nr:hypothetical protein [Rhizobiaceae bacterium]